MVRWVLKSGQRTLFDPSFGLGALFDPVASDPGMVFAGSEKDSKILDFWTGEAGGRKVEIEHEDYLLSWGKSHANIVCNPPYMRFQKFIGRDSVFRAFVDNLGLRLSGYTKARRLFPALRKALKFGNRYLVAQTTMIWSETTRLFCYSVLVRHTLNTRRIIFGVGSKGVITRGF